MIDSLLDTISTASSRRLYECQESGRFWHDRRQRPTHRVPWTRETPEDRERLWRECERLTGWHTASVPAPTHANAQERD